MNGKRKFKYPIQKQETTTDTNDSFPNYRRWNNREHIRGVGESAVVIHNLWISPYSPYLTPKQRVREKEEIMLRERECASD